MRDQFFNFLQNPFEEARARNNLALCVSIPRSDLEMNPDDQRDHDSIKKLCDRLGKAILMSADKLVEREFWAKRSNDVRELPKITLVVMGLEYPAEERATLALMESIVRDSGSVGRTFKSALIFAAADPSENVRDKAREVLGWEDVDDDEETKKRVDESQLNLLKRNLKNAVRDLDEEIFRAYNRRRAGASTQADYSRRAIMEALLRLRRGPADMKATPRFA